MKIQQSVNFKQTNLEESIPGKKMTTKINAQTSPTKNEINQANRCPSPVKSKKATSNDLTGHLSSPVEQEGEKNSPVKVAGKKNLALKSKCPPLYQKTDLTLKQEKNLDSSTKLEQEETCQEKQDEKKISESEEMLLEDYQQEELKLAYQSRNKVKQKNQKLKQTLQTLEQEKDGLKEDLQQTEKHKTSLQEEVNVLRGELGQLEDVIQSRKSSLIEGLKSGEKKLFESIERELPLGKQITFLQKLSEKTNETRFKEMTQNQVLPSLDASRGEMLERAKPIASAFEKLMKNPRRSLR